ncbi:MAG TPA: IS110 family transposase [Pseudonocardiaceae bacterium]|nr:IS110 family transposase [Pseudonocardiaceae bacterium]
MSASYEGRQYVGIDLHRRRSVLVRMTETGERLETVRISNDPEYLRQVMARAGEAPEVVLEAAYGWYWAADTLAELGAHVHLAHPLGVKMFSYRRVKNDELDAGDLADLLRMGRLPEAWIAPPDTRELRGWVRHRAKLVGLRSSLKCQVHAVLAGAGVQVPVSDLFSPGGQHLLATTGLSAESRVRIDSALRLIENLDVEIEQFGKLVTGRLRKHPGYRAIQQIPGVGPLLAAVFVAEIGDIGRFPGPERLASWAGLTPTHHESDTNGAPRPDHQARVPAGALGRGGGGATCRHTHSPRRGPGPGRRPPRPQHRHRRRRPRTGRAGLLRAARRTHPPPRPATTHPGDVNRLPTVVSAGRGGHDPRPLCRDPGAGITAWSPL